MLVHDCTHRRATSTLLAAHAVLKKQEWLGDPFATGRLLVSWGGSTAAQEFMEKLQSRNAAAATGVRQYQVGHPRVVSCWCRAQLCPLWLQCYLMDPIMQR